MSKIIGILTRHYSKRDRNGNVYDYAEYTDTGTGTTVRCLCDNVERIDNAIRTLLALPADCYNYYTEVEHGQRELFKQTKHMVRAGCSGMDGARYILANLNKIPTTNL
jgi:hypothetical protein